MAGLAIAIACTLSLVPVVASAHAVLTAGRYRIAIGWNFEPPGGTVTYVGQPNAVQVFVDIPSPGNDIGTAVSDLNSDCTHPDFQVTVTFAGTTSSPLCPQPAYDPDTGNGRMDEYDALLTPTKVGDYTFRIFGSIHGTSIDQSVKSGPSTFDTVGDESSVEFPAPVPAIGDVATKVDQVDGRAGAAETQASNAASDANRAAVLGVVAIVVAVLLGGANLAMTIRRRRA